MDGLVWLNRSVMALLPLGLIKNKQIRCESNESTQSMKRNLDKFIDELSLLFIIYLLLNFQLFRQIELYITIYEWNF